MRLLFSFLASLTVAAPSWAHHSRAAYNLDEFSELHGELVDVNWRNPHVVFTLQTTDEQGQEKLWRMEAGSMYMLGRGGLTKDFFDAVGQVRVGGYISRQRDNDFLATNMLLAGRREVLTMPDAEPRWTDQRTGGRDNWEADETRLQGDPDAGLFQVWSVPRDDNHEYYLPFTESALDARSEWDPSDNFAVRCEPPGMPDVLDILHPVEFINRGEEILLREETFDVVRTIHIENAVDPETQDPSRLGYSVGRWEGSTLVVETNRINWPWFDRIGTPVSEAIRVVERFTPRADGNRLDYAVTITDPATFMAPARIEGYFLALGESIGPYECEVY